MNDNVLCRGRFLANAFGGGTLGVSLIDYAAHQESGKGQTRMKQFPRPKTLS